MKRVFLLILFLFCATLSACSTEVAEVKVTEEVEIIEDVIQYSEISEEKLISIMGEPAEREEWVNKTSKGNFKMTTLSYNRENGYYEFNIANNSVVGLNIYSNMFWKKEGENFRYYGTKQDICNLFNFELSNTAKIVGNTGYAYRIEDADNKIDDFWILDIDSNSKTFGLVKIKYNSYYFN